MSADDAGGPDAAPSPLTRAAPTTFDAREAVVGEREAAVSARENASLARESLIALREAAALLQVQATRVQDRVDEVGHEVTRLKAQTSRESGELADLLTQVRGANEHLVVAAIHSQTLAEAAEHTNQRQEEFLATLAHELRNPLAPIRSAAHILSLLAANEPRLQYVYEVITRQVGQMARLLDDLLDVARVNSGKVTLQKRAVAVSEFVALAVETCRPLFDKRAQHLTLEIPGEPLYVDGDPVRLAQVFSNLLNNSAKYTQEGGEIALSAHASGSAVVLRVKDNGSGISGEALPRVFDLFAQEGRAAAGGGLGIGLTVVRQMVEMHGGGVTVRSEGAGRGSEFCVTLPLLENVPAATALRSTAELRAPDATYRIVLIDDNVDAAEALKMLLEMMGHDVATAFDGTTAVALVQAVRPQVLVCDIGLPDMDGYAVVTRLRAEMQSVDLPVMIALTGYGHQNNRARAVEAGFDGYLVKPVDAQLLLELIATCPVAQ